MDACDSASPVRAALEPFEERLFAGFDVFGPQARQRLFEQGQGPTAFEFLLGRMAIGGLDAIAAVGVVEIQREQGLSAAAFLGGLEIVLIGQEVLAGAEEIGTKSAFRRIGGGKPVAFEQPNEKTLRQVQCLFVAVSPAANEGINRKPVQFAQFGERPVRRERVIATDGPNQTPARGVKVNVCRHAASIGARGPPLTAPEYARTLNLTEGV